jgi:chloride channel protein, CIC family
LRSPTGELRRAQPLGAHATANTQGSNGGERLGDFTAGVRTIPLSGLAVLVGLLAAVVAKGLLALIAFFTNLFFFQRLSVAAVSPATHHLGLWSILVPVLGCLIIGVIARYGSEKIRGHGIPEALEAILIRGSRIEPRVALLKPIASAISIGSGGPFGAEGPIIMTGGAFGSMIAQLFHLTAAERKTLLVAGAAAGMSATFASPIAAVFLAVELLLFELKPRSLIPVALASIAAAALRRPLLGPGPLFPVPDLDLSAAVDPKTLLACLLVGLSAGALSSLLTAAVYAAEDAFGHLKRIHWMWWPAMGGLVVGVGGVICPQALGVGYDQIQSLLLGGAGLAATLRLVAVKATIWSISLGSGTSGGVLAPLLMMGSALGVLEASFLPAHGAGFWPLIGMCAILGGTMRAPLTALVFAIELSGRFSMALPLLTAAIVAHGFTVLVLKRSILTEKVARRGYHLTREYAIDPLEILFVREVMRPEAVVLPIDTTVGRAAAVLAETARARAQRLYPVVDAAGVLVGVATCVDLEAAGSDADRPLATIVRSLPVVAHANEPLRAAIHRMAETGCTRLPVVDGAEPPHLIGLVTLKEALKARMRHLEEERRRETVLPLSVVIPFARFGRRATPRPPDDAEGKTTEPDRRAS